MDGREAANALVENIEDVDLADLEHLQVELSAEIDARRGKVERGRPLKRIPDEWDQIATDEAKNDYELYLTPAGYAMVADELAGLTVAASGTGIDADVRLDAIEEIVADIPGRFAVRVGDEWHDIEFDSPGGTPMGSIR